MDMRGREKAGRRKGEVAGAAIMRGDKQAWLRCGEQAEPRTSEAAGRRAIGAAGRRFCGAASKRGGGAASMRGGEQADGRVDVSARPSILKLLALQRLCLLHAFCFWTSRAAQLVARPPAPHLPRVGRVTNRFGTCLDEAVWNLLRSDSLHGYVPWTGCPDMNTGVRSRRELLV